MCIRDSVSLFQIWDFCGYSFNKCPKISTNGNPLFFPVSGIRSVQSSCSAGSVVSSIVQLCFINCLCIFSIGKDGKDGQHGGSAINMQQFSFIIRLPVRVTLKLSRNEKQIHNVTPKINPVSDFIAIEQQ